jgi:hypothetical protein
MQKKNGLTCIGRPFFVVADAEFEPTTAEEYWYFKNTIIEM